MKNITIKSLRDKQSETIEKKSDFFKRDSDTNNELEDLPYEPRKTKFIFKKFFIVIFIFIIGGFGGITIDRFALPYLLFKYPNLMKYEFLQRVNEGTTIIKETNEVIISENEAVIDAIAKVSPSVVEIFEFSSDKSSSIYKGAGIVLTSDGYILTSISNITPEEKNSEENKTNIIKIKLKDDSIYETKLIKIDPTMGLAIVKIQKNNLNVITLSNSNNLKLGEKVIVIDSAVVTDIVSKIVDDYKVQITEDKSVTQKRIKIVNSLKKSFDGAPVINTSGEIIGISRSGNSFIPANEVKLFTDSAMN